MHLVLGSRSERGGARRAPTKRVIFNFCALPNGSVLIGDIDYDVPLQLCCIELKAYCVCIYVNRSLFKARTLYTRSPDLQLLTLRIGPIFYLLSSDDVNL